jgi:hypothetical protein
MMWQRTTKVGFGVHDKYVIGWYCENGAQSNDPRRAQQFVGYACNEKGYNDCYNKLALKQVNKLRGNHDVAPLKLNERAARELDFQLFRTEPGKLLLPQPSKRGYRNRGCYQSVFVEADQALIPRVSTSNAAVSYWYDGVEYYDYDHNKPKVVASKQDYAEEGLACMQSVALVYTNERRGAIKRSGVDQVKSAMDCAIACNTNDACVAYETGPDNHCAIFVNAADPLTTENQ